MKLPVFPDLTASTLTCMALVWIRALNGKSVEVIDDGFLKRIRAAQFSNNVTRIVLDVSSVSDYSAFLLPNPWRLIIDVHGQKAGVPPTTTLASLPSDGGCPER